MKQWTIAYLRLANPDGHGEWNASSMLKSVLLDKGEFVDLVRSTSPRVSSDFLEQDGATKSNKQQSFGFTAD